MESSCHGGRAPSPPSALQRGRAPAISSCHGVTLCQGNESGVMPSSAQNAPLTLRGLQRKAKVLPVASQALPC